jgi:hypothetical protein
MYHLKPLKNPLGLSLSFLLSLGLTLTVPTAMWAENPASAPTELKSLINSIESAANQHNLQQLMEFYSPEFSNSDGLNSTNLSKALTTLWQRYPNLKYTTQLQSWEKAGDELVAETITNIQGTSQDGVRVIQLNSTLKSRQYFKDKKLVKQEILSEQTKLTTGNKPPEVEVILPEKVRVGEQFDFDVIIKQPLGNDVLAGTAIEETIETDRYFQPGELKLELLQSGGIFKRAKAPDIPQNKWLSAILVQGDGMTLITQRVRIEK